MGYCSQREIFNVLRGPGTRWTWKFSGVMKLSVWVSDAVPSQLAIGEKCVKPIKRRDTDSEMMAKINVIAELLFKDLSSV